MMQIEITILIAVVGCFVGLAGWLTGRDKKIANDSKWRGGVDAKLDTILGIKSDVEKLDCKVDDHEHRITAVEESAQKNRSYTKRPLGGESRFYFGLVEDVKKL